MPFDDVPDASLRLEYAYGYRSEEMRNRYAYVYVFIHLSVYLSISLPYYLSIPSIRLSMYVSRLFIYLSVCVSVNNVVNLSANLTVYLFICLSLYLPVCLSVRVAWSLVRIERNSAFTNEWETSCLRVRIMRSLCASYFSTLSQYVNISISLPFLSCASFGFNYI